MDAGFLIHFFAREGGLGRVGGEIPRDSITTIGSNIIVHFMVI